MTDGFMVVSAGGNQLGSTAAQDRLVWLLLGLGGPGAGPWSWPWHEASRQTVEEEGLFTERRWEGAGSGLVGFSVSQGPEKEDSSWGLEEVVTSSRGQGKAPQDQSDGQMYAGLLSGVPS